ncbi:hypothetical protein BJY52DRAFT_865519 [Lactarius psammicola]|nr:hypothetical protein BJY52DRAFT_865519 [Lactarius psammicola]
MERTVGCEVLPRRCGLDNRNAPIAACSPLPLLSILTILSWLLSGMPALIPVHNTLGALFIGTILSSVLYGVTWLQVYYYYNSHCSRDRWPLKSFVAFLMLLDTVNLVFVIHEPYNVAITNFGDYLSDAFQQLSWGQSAIALSTIVLDFSVQNFYAYRIYRLGRGSPYLPVAISVVSLAELGVGIVYSTKILKYIHEPGTRFEEFLIPTLSCKVLCDVLITVGMVYYLLSNRTRVRRTDNVLNLLTIYTINCGTLHLVFAICCVILLAKYRDTLIYIPFLFVTIRLSLCAFMSILNSRDNLRETLDRPGGVVSTFTQLKVRAGTAVPWATRDTMEASTNMAVPKSLPPASVSFDTSSSDSGMASDRKKYPVPPL